MEYIQTFIYLLEEMAPYLLLGFFLAGILHVYVPKSIYSDYLSKKSFKSVVLAALFGIPLPLCSCGVIPTAMSLRKEGASKGATTSFLIATPQTGVDSIIATYSLMGLPFAIIRPLVALITALFGGAVVNRVDKGTDDVPTKEISNCEDSCCKAQPKKENRFIAALRYGFVDMIQDVGKWLVIGLIVAGLITILVPDSFFGMFADKPLLNILMVLLFSVPMYLCATGSIPIAVALMLKGLSPGAALVLLMAGPATNAASILVIGKVMGRKTMFMYLIAIITGAVVFGLVIDYLLPASWFTLPISQVAHAHCQSDSSSWVKIVSSIFFVLLLINAMILKYRKPKKISNTMEREYKITGMSCNHCKMSVEKNIGKLQGVTSVHVDLEKGIVYVEGEVSELEVKKTVEELGFEFIG